MNLLGNSDNLQLEVDKSRYLFLGCQEEEDQDDQSEASQLRQESVLAAGDALGLEEEEYSLDRLGSLAHESWSFFRPGSSCSRSIPTE